MKTSDNLSSLRNWSNLLLAKIKLNWIMIKPTGKGCIVVVKIPKCY